MPLTSTSLGLPSPLLLLPSPLPPQHFVADTHKLQMMSLDPTRFGMQPHKFNGKVTPPLKLRAHSFLTDERTSESIRTGVVDVAVVDAAATAAAAAPAHVLVRGATNVEVKAQLAALRDARVLKLSDAEGVFGGWARGGEAGDRDECRLFSTLMDYYVHRGAWCCSSRNQAQQDDGRVYVRHPPAFKYML